MLTGFTDSTMGHNVFDIEELDMGLRESLKKPSEVAHNTKSWISLGGTLHSMLLNAEQSLLRRNGEVKRLPHE